MRSKNQQIDELLSRGVEKVIKKENLENRLKNKEKLNLKLGIDPTGTDIHIGNMVAIRKMANFQKLGHKVTIIVGDYTARIGDPSGKDKMREPLTKEQVHANMKTYKKQLLKILDPKKTTFAYQSKWFNKMNLADMIELASIFTVQQMLERDMYKKRLKQGNPIGVHEFIYPLLQGYDSVAIKSDVEFGGSDQEFNLLVGRTMQERFKQKSQDILTTSLLLGTDGRKMSKTYNNYIGVMDEPKDMFGKVMSAIDDVIVDYFLLCTDVPTDEIDNIAASMKSGKLNPRDAKARLAREIVTIYHGECAGRDAEAEFEKIFKNRKKPSNIREWKFAKPSYVLADLITASGLVKSKNEARRVAKQRGVKIDNKVINDPQAKIDVKNNMIAQVGKRRFVKFVK